jgi:hypothetical protein
MFKLESRLSRPMTKLTVTINAMDTRLSTNPSRRLSQRAKLLGLDSKMGITMEPATIHTSKIHRNSQ